MSDVLLATKIHIPSQRRDLVNRPRLIQQLNDGIEQNCRLTLVSAPAGYGKSTLISEWACQLRFPVAWLSLEAGENTLVRFWSYFITSLSAVPHLRQAGACESFLKELQSPKPPPMEAWLANLANACSNLTERVILVLDDLHFITDSQIHQDLVFLIDHLLLSATGLHLVVASRMDPPWPLARWRARSELNELRPADLRFSFDETVQFLNQVLKLKLSLPEVTALQGRTEGWITGLQMAAISMQGHLKSQGLQGVTRFIETFTGSNRFILDYLIEEVISQQPAGRRDFLYETSILEQFTASLCNALLDRQDSQVFLEELEQANLFLVPLDDVRQWYRYHHLFAELLRQRLKLAHPEKITRLHQRASQWYAENGFLTEAIAHALDAEDVLRVNEFVSGNALAMVDQAELLDVLMHFKQMPEALIFSKPWLCVAYAWVKAYADPSGEVERILQPAELAVPGIENVLERRRLTSHLAAIRAYIAWVKGEAEVAFDFTRQALENLPEKDWKARAHLLNIKGLVLQYLNDFPAAQQSFQAAVTAGQRTGNIQETYNPSANLAFVNLLQGHLHQAFSICRQVLDLASQQPGQASGRLPVLAYAYATMSIVQLEWNEVESALKSARQGVELAERWNQADTLHFALSCLTIALCAAGELDEAFVANRRGMQLALNVSPWFYHISANNEIELNLVKGDLSAASSRLKEIESEIRASDRGKGFLILKAALLYAQKRFSESLAVLEQIAAENEQTGNYWHWMSIMPIRALVLQAQGREAEALGVLRRCLVVAEPEGFVRKFLVLGAPMAMFLRVALSRGIATEYIQRLLMELEGAHLPRSQPPVPGAGLVEPLSERELQVLRLLDSALTNEEIGSELYISVNTVRTHLRNIYAKLGVQRRGDAVRRAKELKLL